MFMYLRQIQHLFTLILMTIQTLYLQKFDLMDMRNELRCKILNLSNVRLFIKKYEKYLK